VPATAADTSALEAWVGFRPTTAIETGVERFAEWYLSNQIHGDQLRANQIRA
jgi:UDP-glucuronate 4-epimerase